MRGGEWAIHNMPSPARGGNVDGNVSGPTNATVSPRDIASRLLGIDYNRTSSGNPLKPRKSYLERVTARQLDEELARGERRDEYVVSVDEFPELAHLIKVLRVDAALRRAARQQPHLTPPAPLPAFPPLLLKKKNTKKKNEKARTTAGRTRV